MDMPDATWRDDRPAEQHIGWPAGWSVEVVDETGSTNVDLLAKAANGAPDRTVLMARHQTAGRGRLDRTWDAPPDTNLLVSLLLRDVPVHAHEVTQRLGLAAITAVQRVAGVHARLKWPNDVLLDGRKLAGVLAQAGGQRGIEYVVVGIGLNVGWAPPDAACLGAEYRPELVLSELLQAYDELPAAITRPYREALATLGTDVAVHVGSGDSATVLRGRAIDVEADGRLVVLDDCAISHRISTGDVVHLR